MPSLAQVITAVLAALLSGSVVAAVLGAVLQRRTTTIHLEIKSRFDSLAAVSGSQRAWRERSVAELLAPIAAQLERTQRAFERWNDQNLYLEAKVIREGNVTIRDLLLTKTHLIPPDLLLDAASLVAHYDRWLEEFDRLRSEQNPGAGAKFVFVAAKGYPFPRDAADKFQKRFLELWNELYAGPADSTSAATDRTRSHASISSRPPARMPWITAGRDSNP
jgi:hypothetical protein